MARITKDQLVQQNSELLGLMKKQSDNCREVEEENRELNGLLFVSVFLWIVTMAIIILIIFNI